MINWLMQKNPKERPNCAQILNSSVATQWIDKLQQAGKGVQVCK
jgi:hypothetical protein